MVEKNGNPMDSMNSKQTFVLGLVGGVLVLCTIGFFVLLGMFVGDGDGTKSPRIVKGDSVVAGEGPEQFSQCLDSGKYADVVKADFQLGAQLGVNGTPATFINGYLVSGALPYDAIKQVIDTLLAGGEPDFDFMKNQEGNIVKVNMPELPGVDWKGNDNSPITVVEFSDFECPYCARFIPTVSQMLAEYGDEIRFTYRHFPLSFHTNAQKAAEAFECAKEQGMWYEMHNELFDLSEASNLNIAAYKNVASELGLK